jgi:hypothetical protein
MPSGGGYRCALCNGDSDGLSARVGRGHQVGHGNIDRLQPRVPECRDLHCRCREADGRASARANESHRQDRHNGHGGTGPRFGARAAIGRGATWPSVERKRAVGTCHLTVTVGPFLADDRDLAQTKAACVYAQTAVQSVAQLGCTPSVTGSPCSCLMRAARHRSSAAAQSLQKTSALCASLVRHTPP